MDKRRARDGITGGLLLVGLGVLLLTGWWWPGIMVVLGIAIGAGLVFRGRYLAGVVMAAIFFAIPLLTQTDIPWNIFGPMILIGVGVVVLVKAFVLREESRASSEHDSGDRRRRRRSDSLCHLGALCGESLVGPISRLSLRHVVDTQHRCAALHGESVSRKQILSWTRPPNLAYVLKVPTCSC